VIRAHGFADMAEAVAPQAFQQFGVYVPYHAGAAENQPRIKLHQRRPRADFLVSI
jgi:hypothetical protein